MKKKIVLSNEVKTSIINFFNSVNELSNKNVIRSSNFIGNIAEFICCELYDLDQCKNQRQIGFDAMRNDQNKDKFQIKINNSAKKTNQTIGDPSKYSFLLLVITSNSFLFNKKYSSARFLIYKIPSKILQRKKYIAKELILNYKPEIILDNDFEKMNSEVCI